MRDSSGPGAAECHGLLCALLTFAGDDAAVLLGRLLGYSSDEIEIPPQLAPMLGDLVQASAAWLGGGDYDFRLFLPDDTAPLGERAGALGDWCRGYLDGMLEAGINDFDTLPAESAEMVRDMAAISALDVTDDPGGSEADLVQLEEYVRVGIQLIYESSRTTDGKGR